MVQTSQEYSPLPTIKLILQKESDKNIGYP